MTPDEVKEYRSKAARKTAEELNKSKNPGIGPELRRYHEMMASYYDGQVDAYDLVLMGMRTSR
jgi:hypothetical protein